MAWKSGTIKPDTLLRGRDVQTFFSPCQASVHIGKEKRIPWGGSDENGFSRSDKPVLSAE